MRPADQSNDWSNPTPSEYKHMVNDLISAFILGLIGGVIPGPVLAATFTEILQYNFLKSAYDYSYRFYFGFGDINLCS